MLSLYKLRNDFIVKIYPLAFFTIRVSRVKYIYKTRSTPSFNDISKEAYFSFPFAIEIYFFFSCVCLFKKKKRNEGKTTAQQDGSEGK